MSPISLRICKLDFILIHINKVIELQMLSILKDEPCEKKLKLVTVSNKHFTTVIL